VAKNGHEISGCPLENTEPSETRIYIGGSFFNDGTGTSPGNNNYTGDIFVGIGLYKYSNSTDIPTGYVGVRSRIRQCLNSDCSDFNQLHETFFPDKNLKPLLLKIGKKEKFRITYDQLNNTFTLQVGRKNIVSYVSTVENVQASGAAKGGMRLEVAHYLANCSTTRSSGWADVVFDNVMVQE